MTSIRKFSQTPPDNANELFEQLLATSNNAAKARERLLFDLKEELELLANLQEQYLFPVLRKNAMPDLVREAINDNQETGALLAELERMPKNNGDFISKIASIPRPADSGRRSSADSVCGRATGVASELVTTSSNLRFGVV